VDFIFENWVLITIALSSGIMLMWPMIMGGGGANTVSPTQAVQLINKDKAVVIDVCSEAEFTEGHVNGAKNIPVDELESRLTKVAKNKANPVLMVCASGIRSRRAVGLAKKQGYEQVFSLAGGMSAWRSANLPVQKGAKS
jgi:rhodanese-related sulfurtransferase